MAMYLHEEDIATGKKTKRKADETDEAEDSAIEHRHKDAKTNNHKGCDKKVGLRNTREYVPWKWLREGEAFVIGHSLGAFVLPEDLVKIGLSYSLFKNRDNKMRKQHALIYVFSGRVFVRILRKKQASRGLAVLASNETDVWEPIGESGADEEIKHGSFALTASRCLDFVIKLQW
jgi:hypothetical protein